MLYHFYFNIVVLEESSVVQELSWNDLTIRNNKGMPSADSQGEHKIKMHRSGDLQIDYLCEPVIILDI